MKAAVGAYGFPKVADVLEFLLNYRRYFHRKDFRDKIVDVMIDQVEIGGKPGRKLGFHLIDQDFLRVVLEEFCVNQIRVGDELVIKGKSFGTMPLQARLDAAGARAGLKLLGWKKLAFLATLPFRSGK